MFATAFASLYDAALVSPRVVWTPAAAGDIPPAYTIRETLQIGMTPADAPELCYRVNALNLAVNAFDPWAVPVERKNGARSVDCLLCEAADLHRLGFHFAAGCLARTALDTYLRGLLSLFPRLKVKRPNVLAYVDALRRGGVIDSFTRRRLLELQAIGNRCAHNTATVEPADVERMIEGIRGFVRGGAK